MLYAYTQRTKFSSLHHHPIRRILFLLESLLLFFYFSFCYTYAVNMVPTPVLYPRINERPLSTARVIIRSRTTGTDTATLQNIFNVEKLITKRKKYLLCTYVIIYTRRCSGKLPRGRRCQIDFFPFFFLHKKDIDACAYERKHCNNCNTYCRGYRNGKTVCDGLQYVIIYLRVSYNTKIWTRELSGDESRPDFIGVARKQIQQDQ